MNLYPAIDLLDGCVVRLRQGDYQDQTVYSHDPVQIAQSFVAQGATWIHIVDLDAAKSGKPTNRAVIGQVVQSLSGAARVQVGGGVRLVSDAEALKDLGVNRVVMGSAAVAKPALVGEVAKQIDVAVGLDHRNGIAATHGWTESSGVLVDELLSRFEDASAFIITDISRDGMLTGPDVEGLAHAISLTKIPVIASGGVGNLEHVRQLAALLDLDGIIVGKALYENRFTVEEAVEVLG